MKPGAQDILAALAEPPATPGVLVLHLCGSAAVDRLHRESDWPSCAATSTTCVRCGSA